MIILMIIIILAFSFFFGMIVGDGDNLITDTIKGLGVFFLLAIVLKILATVLGLGMTAHGL